MRVLKSILTIGGSTLGILSSQTVLLPEVRDIVIAESRVLTTDQEINASSNSNMVHVKRQITAKSLKGNRNNWISLGLFQQALLHRLEIGTEGTNSGSGAIIEFIPEFDHSGGECTASTVWRYQQLSRYNGLQLYV